RVADGTLLGRTDAINAGHNFSPIKWGPQLAEPVKQLQHLGIELGLILRRYIRESPRRTDQRFVGSVLRRSLAYRSSNSEMVGKARWQPARRVAGRHGSDVARPWCQSPARLEYPFISTARTRNRLPARSFYLRDF